MDEGEDSADDTALPPAPTQKRRAVDKVSVLSLAFQMKKRARGREREDIIVTIQIITDGLGLFVLLGFHMSVKYPSLLIFCAS